jgi:hypothetical protein
MASQQRFELKTRALGALPIVGHFVARLGLEALLGRWLAEDDVRALMPAARAITVLIVNLCVCREPLYGIAELPAAHDLAALGLGTEELALLSDLDRGVTPVRGE